MGEEDPADDLSREVADLRAPSRRALRQAVLLVAVAAVLTPVWQAQGDQVRRFVRGEVDLEGEPAYEPPHEPDPEALAEIDFERVHAELIPRWTLALANASSPYWERHADDVFDQLRAEVSPDPNLTDLLEHTHAALREDPLEKALRLDYWLWAYNRYLDDHGLPWRLEAVLSIGEERTVLRTRTYEILADAENADGHRLRLLRRADPLNTVEGWLGRTGRGDDGAMILMRRVLHFAVRHVWPALHPALDGRRPAAERSWLPYVRTEIAAQLDPETYRLLVETASDQQALIEVAASVHARAPECGGRLRFDGLPYNGLTDRSLYAIQMALQRSYARPDCPDITLDEAARIVGASERLGDTDGIEAAIERLAMVVARAVAAHELRHVADGEALECPGCSARVVGLAREEVSAYLSSFASTELPYLALLQACAAPRSRGLHGAARQAVLEAVLPYGCEGPPMDALPAVARQIEVQLFGERAPVSVPALPDRVRLLSRPARVTRRARPTATPLASGWGMSLRP